MQNHVTWFFPWTNLQNAQEPFAVILYLNSHSQTACMVCVHTLVNDLHPPCTYNFNGYNTYTVSTMACESIHQKYILWHTPFNKTCFWISDWIMLWSYIFLLEILRNELLWNKSQFYLRYMQQQTSQKNLQTWKVLKVATPIHHY